jgi:drug/metabolite transporter (DMT)-like permease
LTGAVALFLTGVVMASSGQVLMKKGALRGKHRSIAVSFINPLTITGYALMLASTVASTISLKTMPLRLTVSLLPLGYLVVVILSVAVLGERMHRHHVWGALMILAGIIIFNLGTL